MGTKETTVVSGVEKLLEAQKEIGAITKSQDNPYFKSKYADINVILAVVKPILNKHGLVLVQGLQVIEGKNGLNTVVVEANTGKSILESNCFLPDTVKAQETGSAITYFRRYAIQSLLALEAVDDDGNTASGKTEKKEYKTPETKKGYQSNATVVTPDEDAF